MSEYTFIDNGIGLYEDDSKIDLINELSEIVEAVKIDPSAFCDDIQSEIEKTKDKLLEDNKCPECGHEMEFVRDERLDTWVPYGSTSVLESEGGYMVCPECGYKAED